jgi:hypothetical protein
MITLRDFGFAVIGGVAGPLVAAGVFVGYLAWAQPMAAGWVRFSNENWRDVVLQLAPWPRLLIDGGGSHPEVTEAFFLPVS